MIHERVRAWSGVAVVRVSALGMAAILLLAGCSGDGEPGAEAAEVSNSASPSGGATASASASASPMPTPTVAAYKPASAEGPAENVPLPVMPELAKQESKEGLEAFAKHWYALVNYGFETGDVEPLKQVSGPECSLCLSVYDLVGRGHKNSDWMVGGQFEVLGTQSNYVLTSMNTYQVLIHLSQASYEYRAPQNHVYNTYEAVPTSVHMIEATYGDSGWAAYDAVIMK